MARTRSSSPAVRREAIQRELVIHGAISVDALADSVKASLATIRRDLAVLERQGAIERTHGGAMVANPRPADQAFAVRERQDSEEKQGIARHALRAVQPGHTLFLNDGTTTMALAREIAAARLEVFVATPGLNIASVLAQCPSITVCLIGGFVRPNALGTSGHFAEGMVEQINADIAFLSPDGMTRDGGLTFSHASDAALARKMASHADRVIVLATGRKLLRDERIMAMRLSELHTLITCPGPQAVRKKMAEAGIDLEIARPVRPGERGT